MRQDNNFNDKDKYNLADSTVEAFSFSQLIKRVFLFLVFGVLLGLKKLISNIDAVGMSGGGFFQYLGAIGKATLYGVVLSLGSMWAVIINPNLYLKSHSYGSIGFTVFSMIVLIMFFYQPIAMIINVLDGQRGQATGFILRLTVTLLFVVILSCIVFYAGGRETITTNLNNSTMVNNTAPHIPSGNITDVINETVNPVKKTGSVIDLL